MHVLATYFNKKRLAKCPKIKTVYRPKIRTFIEEQEQPASVYGIFKDIFNKSDPWVRSTWTNPSQTEVGLQQPFSWGDLPNNEIGGSDNQPRHYENQKFY